MDKHQLLTLTDDLTRIVSASAWNVERFNHIHFVVNVVAGGVSKKKRFLNSAKVVRDVAAGVIGGVDLPPITRSIHLTEGPGHAAQITGIILDEPESDGRLIISIGGDGTHREVCSAFAERLGDTSGPDRRNIVLFRMPMGTGNDGADAFETETACGILQRGGALRSAGAVRVTATGMHAMYAFNVTSIGIDAYVTDTSNRMKNAVPGDIYKVIADAATLFYEPVYGVDEVELTITDDNGRQTEHRDRYILVAMGPTGNRCYGNGKRILPTDNNLCAIRTVSLPKKIAMKKHVYEGTHVGLPGTLSAQVKSMVVNYRRRVPLQLDGEGVWLSPENFPVRFERVDNAIPVLSTPTGGA